MGNSREKVGHLSVAESDMHVALIPHDFEPQWCASVLRCGDCSFAGF